MLPVGSSRTDINWCNNDQWNGKIGTNFCSHSILLQYDLKQAVMSENTSKTIHHYILLFTSLQSVEPKHDYTAFPLLMIS